MKHLSDRYAKKWKGKKRGTNTFSQSWIYKICFRYIFMVFLVFNNYTSEMDSSLGLRFKSSSDVKKEHLKPCIISAGRKRQSILQIDSFRRRWSWNILASPIYSSAGRYTQSRKLIPQRRAWIYDAKASATEQGLFPSGLGAAAARRFTTRMTRLITLGYWRELDMDQLQGCLVCLCFWKGKGNHRFVCSPYQTWSSANHHDLHLFPGTNIRKDSLLWWMNEWKVLVGKKGKGKWRNK